MAARAALVVLLLLVCSTSLGEAFALQRGLAGLGHLATGATAHSSRCAGHAWRSSGLIGRVAEWPQRGRRRPPRPARTRLHSLLGPNDAWALRATVVGAAAAGLSLGDTKLGKAVSPPVCAMAITFFLSNAGVLPPGGSPHVTELQGVCVRLCAPLLLFGANLRTLRSGAGKLLPAFGLGALGTVLGAAVGFALCGPALAAGLGAAADAPKLAAALLAKNVGGGVNFVAVSAALGLSPAAAAAGLTADNVMALLYFPLCNYLGRGANATAAAREETPPLDAPAVAASGGAAGEGAILKAVAVAAVLVALGEGLCPTWGIVASSGLAVAAATLFPKRLGPLDAAGTQMGTVLLYVFFATAGAAGTGVAATLVWAGLPLLAFLTILYAVHLAVVLGLGTWLGFDRASLLVASNCNIGGPATAASLCVGRNWPNLLKPALLVGNLGYALANVAALVLHAAWTQ